MAIIFTLDKYKKRKNYNINRGTRRKKRVCEYEEKQIIRWLFLNNCFEIRKKKGLINYELYVTLK